jgi:ribosomal protein S18 acetylase RimI-like enzyme
MAPREEAKWNFGAFWSKATIPSMTQSASGVQVRRATTDDAAWVASVLRQAFAEYEPLYTEQGYAATTPGAGEIAARMGEGPVWVAVDREQIVGTGSVVSRREGSYIRGMAVTPSARGLGIGRRLLDEIQRFAIGQGCRRLFLSTTPFLDRAICLYEAFGFRRINDGPHDLFGTPLFTMEKTVALAIEEEPRNPNLSNTAKGLRRFGHPTDSH